MKSLEVFFEDLSLALDKSPFPVAVWYEAGVFFSAWLTERDNSDNQELSQKLYSWIRERWVLLSVEDKERHTAKIELARSEYEGNSSEAALELLKHLGIFDLDLESLANWPIFPKRGNAQLERALAAGIEHVLNRLDGISKLEQMHQQIEKDSAKKLRDDDIQAKSDTAELIDVIESKLDRCNFDNFKDLEEVVNLLENLFEIDEYEFIVFLEDYLDENDMSHRYQFSNTVLTHLHTNREFVGTFFSILSGVDLIDPNNMPAVIEIETYPFSSDSDTFNNTKCPSSSVALSKEVPNEILEKLSMSPEVGVRYRVALNPNAQEQTLINLINFALKQESDQVDMLTEYILATVALHRNSTSKVNEALENSIFASTLDVIELRNKSDFLLCSESNTDCKKLSPKIVLGNSLLWWELTDMSWARPGLQCAQGSECKLGFLSLADQ